MAGDEGVAEASVREVCVDMGSGMGTWAERSMWYVWMEARMKRQDKGMTASPSLLVRAGVVKALPSFVS
jgi:hypothetical protein